MNHTHEMRLHRLVLEREAMDEPTPEPEPGEGDMPLIPDCEGCGNAGYLCVCDWLASDEQAA